MMDALNECLYHGPLPLDMHLQSPTQCLLEIISKEPQILHRQNPASSRMLSILVGREQYPWTLSPCHIISKFYLHSLKITQNSTTSPNS